MKRIDEYLMNSFEEFSEAIELKLIIAESNNYEYLSSCFNFFTSHY